jgi:tetratricopeptide (TPR) repeat protein
MTERKAIRCTRIAATALFVAAAGMWATLAARAQSASPEKKIQQLFDAGKYRQAVQEAQAAVGKAPPDAVLDYWLGRCDYELRDFNRAVASLERAVAMEPDNSEYHDWLGRAYGQKAARSNFLSGFSLARKTHRELETAVRLDKTNLAAQRDLIRFLLVAPGIVGGGEDRALQQIAALSVVSATEANLARAEYFQTRKRFDLANEQYEKVMQADPSRIGVYLEIADYYAERGDPQRMQKAIDAAASVSPSDRRLEYYRGVVLVLEKARPQEAEAHLRTYLASVPDNSELPSHAWAQEWLGRLYENQQRLQDAAREYREALALDPHNREFREALKRLQHK